MTYGTSHLLIGVGVFSVRGSRKILLYKGGHYMKNKNIGEMSFCQLNMITKKAPMQKCAKMHKNIKH